MLLTANKSYCALFYSENVRKKAHQRERERERE